MSEWGGPDLFKKHKGSSQIEWKEPFFKKILIN